MRCKFMNKSNNALKIKTHISKKNYLDSGVKLN